MSRTRYRFGEDHYPHFITNTIVAWLPVFSDPDCVAVVLDSWRFLQKERQIQILGWVILENHLHWIAVGPQLSRRVAEFKSFTATSILKLLESRGRKTLLQELWFYKLHHKTDQQHQLWQEGSQPKIIECIEVMRQKLDYTHYNSVRRGYVDDPVHWRYSSARSYAGQQGLIEITTDWC